MRYISSFNESKSFSKKSFYDLVKNDDILSYLLDLTDREIISIKKYKYHEYGNYLLYKNFMHYKDLFDDDLYCDDRAPVYCVEDGRVVNIENFTGESAQSPWWNETKAILVESKSGVLVYGEIDVDESIHIGKNIKIGDILGYVIPVLKKDKGTPMCMLHFELYKHGTTSTVWWKLEDDKPSNLLNPTTLLKSL